MGLSAPESLKLARAGEMEQELDVVVFPLCIPKQCSGRVADEIVGGVQVFRC
jgi:hypothetical protein